MEKYCCQCGETNNLFELKNGAYACENCLNKVGKEQQMFRQKIEEVFGKEDLETTMEKLNNILTSIENTSIITLKHLISSVNAIKYMVKLENGTLEDEKIKDMVEILKKWSKNIDNNEKL